GAILNAPYFPAGVADRLAKLAAAATNVEDVALVREIRELVEDAVIDLLHVGVLFLVEVDHVRSSFSRDPKGSAASTRRAPLRVAAQQSSRQNPRAVEIELEAQLAQPLGRHCAAQEFRIVGHEHQEAAAAGADQLAADGPIRPRHLVPAID